MAFLDNSGDIILDAVLTDTGRQMLSRGDGSFKITHFSLGDDEIDYGLYNTAHTGGTEYYDLEILQTPILEAFTNNMSSMKSKLVTYTSNNLLHLPVLLVDDGKNPKTGNVKGGTDQWQNWGGTATSESPSGMFVVAVDKITTTAFVVADVKGVMGASVGATGTGIGTYIRVQQGLDTTDISPVNKLSRLAPELIETQFDIEIDSRLGHLVATDESAIPISYIDDDLIAVYRVSKNTGNVVSPVNNTDDSAKAGSPRIRGPRGNELKFRIRPSLELQTASHLFTKIGTTPSSFTTANTALTSTQATEGSGEADNNLNTRAVAGELLFIDTNVRVSGVTTGISVDIPVRFYKCTGCKEATTS